jgi:hypothetical protein
MQVWFVIAILEYLNFAMFSNDPLSLSMLWLCSALWRRDTEIHIVSPTGVKYSFWVHICDISVFAKKKLSKQI